MTITDRPDLRSRADQSDILLAFVDRLREHPQLSEQNAIIAHGGCHVIDRFRYLFCERSGMQIDLLISAGGEDGGEIFVRHFLHRFIRQKTVAIGGVLLGIVLTVLQ